ncbi:MAG TPA: hypothetical protein VF762_14295 [Blastocatellia bacterium]|jgi:hypothetical protein
MIIYFVCALCAALLLYYALRLRRAALNYERQAVRYAVAACKLDQARSAELAEYRESVAIFTHRIKEMCLENYELMRQRDMFIERSEEAEKFIADCLSDIKLDFME